MTMLNELRKITNKILLPFRIITFEVCSVLTLYQEFIERQKALRKREKSVNLLAYKKDDEKKQEDEEIKKLRESMENARTNLLKSNRAIIGFVLAIIAFTVPYCFSKRTELLLNRENQSLKEEVKYLNRQLTEQQREHNLLQKKIEDMKKTRK